MSPRWPTSEHAWSGLSTTPVKKYSTNSKLPSQFAREPEIFKPVPCTKVSVTTCRVGDISAMVGGKKSADPGTAWITGPQSLHLLNLGAILSGHAAWKMVEEEEEERPSILLTRWAPRGPNEIVVESGDGRLLSMLNLKWQGCK